MRKAIRIGVRVRTQRTTGSEKEKGDPMERDGTGGRGQLDGDGLAWKGVAGGWGRETDVARRGCITDRERGLHGKRRKAPCSGPPRREARVT
eukprot:scaffold1501_cov352-Pavlova_lutheri.AAC.16